ncbi:MAG: OadG family protein [Tissierellia bacterium]|nr:OadG family protein [Tissierellia bacterium]
MKEFAAIQDMSQMPIMERLMHGLTVTALGMGITFIVLILLLYSIKLMSFVFKKEDSPTSLVSDPVTPTKALEEEDDEELVAVLIAAVAAATGQSYDKIKVRGYREVGIDLPLWGQAGILETMNREI